MLSHRVLFFTTLFIGFLFRLIPLHHGVGFHPDERHIAFILLKLSLSDPNPHSFAYGGLYYHTCWFLSQVVRPFGYHYENLLLFCRFLSIIYGTLTLLTVYGLGRFTVNKQVGLLAMILLATTPLHIQSSAFATVDVALTFYISTSLLFLVLYHQRRNWLWLVLASLTCAAACAVKASGLAACLAFVALFVVQILESPRTFRSSIIGKIGVYAGAATLFLTTTLAFQPYSIMDYQEFYRGVMNQINMVQGIWVPPYTVQYMHTTPYLYPLLNMHWALGTPHVFLCWTGLLFCGYWVIRRDYNGALVTLLAWTMLFFLVVGKYQVKFPRYMLPIYPTLCLFGATMVNKLWQMLHQFRHRPGHGYRTHQRWVTAFAILCVLAPLSRLAIYSQPHVWQLASRWINQNVEPGAVLLSEHWDDALPVNISGLKMVHYDRSERWQIAIHEPNTEKKWQTIAAQLAGADYMILPTKRAYGAIQQNPAKYQTALKYYSRLFRGELGYTMIQSFKVSPTLGPLTFDDSAADESLSVYSHPKVVIFKNEYRLSQAEIFARIDASMPTDQMMSREELVFANAGQSDIIEQLKRDYYGTSRWLQLVYCGVWVMLLLALSTLVWVPLTIFTNVPQWINLCTSLVVGPIVFCYGCFLLNLIGLIEASPGTLRLGLILSLSAVVTLAWWQRQTLLKRLATDKTYIWPLTIALCVFGLMLFQRVLHPAIYWGERPMNFSFLNYFMRATTLPAEDPWFAGENMSYYYFSTYLYAVVMKIGGIPSQVGYNLALASVPAQAAGAIMCCIGAMGMGVRAAAWGVAFVMAGNLAFYLEWFARGQLNFNQYWATSRQFKHAIATEYPLWGYIFGDLHAHVIMAPATLCVVGLCVYWLRNISLRFNGWAISCAAVLCPAVFAGNTWDAVSLAIVLPIVALFGATLYYRQWLRIVFALLLFVGIALPLTGIQLLALPSNQNHAWGLTRHGFTTPQEYMSHYGLFLAVQVLAYSAFTWQAIRSFNWTYLAKGLLASAAVLGLWFYYQTYVPSIPIFLFAMLAIFLGWGWWVIPRGSLRPYILVFGTSAITLNAVAEGIFLADRMNTLFKMHNFIWPLLALHTWGCLVLLIRSQTRERFFFIPAAAIPVTAALLAGVLTWFTMLGKTYVGDVKGTLDGTAYMRGNWPGDAAAVQWLNTHIRGTPAILEAHGPSYQRYSRISMNTGLPTFIGWDHHVKQRGAPPEAIEKRKQLAKRIYQSQAPPEAYALLRENGIKYVVFGELERKTYQLRGNVFAQAPRLFQAVFDKGSTQVFQVRLRNEGKVSDPYPNGHTEHTPVH